MVNTPDEDEAKASFAGKDALSWAVIFLTMDFLRILLHDKLRLSLPLTAGMGVITMGLLSLLFWGPQKLGSRKGFVLLSLLLAGAAYSYVRFIPLLRGH